MLDVQRYRGDAFREEVIFSRKVMLVHLVTGAVVITLLLFHELFGWFGGVLAWYGAVVMAMLGYMSSMNWCRWVLALLFVIATATGLYFTTSVFPTLQAPKAPIVPQTLIPIWVGLMNLIFGVCAILMLFSGKIRRAGVVGFTLW